MCVYLHFFMRRNSNSSVHCSLISLSTVDESQHHISLVTRSHYGRAQHNIMAGFNFMRGPLYTMFWQRVYYYG